jgi:hypothetical protein
MANTWVPLVRPPIDGEPINQETEARPIKALQQRTDFLFERLNDFSAQNGKLVIQNVRVSSDVEVGDWVHFNNDSQKYEKAIAEGILDENLNQYRASSRTFVVGMCVQRNQNLGTILMNGWIKDIKDFEITNIRQMLEDTTEQFKPGRFYLSRKKPGKMTSIGGAPLVQLGFFTEKDAFVQPLQKDIFESHIHYKFVLESKPSASQNISRTGYINIDGVKYVDYFYSSSKTQDDAPSFVMCLKGNGSFPIITEQFRVDIIRTLDNKISFRLVYGTLLDFDNPESGAHETISQANIPSYGEWVNIPNTGFDIAFIRPDAIYTGRTLQEDFSVLSADGVDKFCIYFPYDTYGWTNVNPFEGRYTNGTKYRYLREFNKRVNAVWPPVPTESVSISNNGIDLIESKDFKCYPQELLWIPGTFDNNEQKTDSPWPHDYIARRLETDPDPNESFSKHLQLFFSKANVSTARPLVLSLQSFTPAIQVVDCFTKNEATSGNLALDLRLDLNTSDGPDSDKCFARIDPGTQKFITSPLVSRVVAGQGIEIKNVQGATAETGKVIISSTTIQSSGEVSIVSLKNAKEALHNGVIPCITFLPPNTAKCQIVAKIKIPIQSIPESSGIKLFLSSNIFGSTSVSQTNVFNALFKVNYFIFPALMNVAPRSWNSFNLNYIDDSTDDTSFSVKHWKLPLSNYAAYTVDKDQFPRQNSIIQSNGNSDLFVFSGKINNIDQQKIRPGDTIYVMIERISTYDSEGDTYPGDISFLDINWRTEVV